MHIWQCRVEAMARRAQEAIDKAPEYRRIPRKRRYWNPERCGRIARGGTSYYPEYAPPPVMQRVMLRVGRALFC
jgi:hypothetical protein